jgi:hypothetical protein
MNEGRRTDVVSLASLASLAGAALLLIVWLIARSASGQVDPLAAVPADSFLVVSIDVAALARSPLGAPLASEGGARTGSLLGVESVTATCGFEPLSHLRAIAIALPEGGERGEFGVAASSDLTKDALLSCAKALIAKRGGQASVREAGTFTVVSDASAGGAEVAFRAGGPLLAGRGAWLARMMDAASGQVPSILTAAGAPHGDLRQALAKRDVDAEAVVVSAVLPRDLRDRLRHELEGEAKSGGAMDGVLAVSEGALGVHAGRAGEDTRIVAELRCETAAACDSVATVILHARLGWSGNLAYRLFGLGGLIDGLDVQRQGTTLLVRTHAPSDDLARMLDRALHPPERPKPKTPSSSAPLAPPDAMLRARLDAGK